MATENEFTELVHPTTGTKRTPGDQAEYNDLRWRGYIEADHPAAAGPPVAPPLTGAGSGRAAWAEYAARVGVEVSEAMTRDEIVSAVEATQGSPA